MIRQIIIACFAIISPFYMPAQTNVDKAKTTLSNYIKYSDIEKKPEDTLNHWAGWLATGEDESLQQSNRVSAYQKLYQSIFETIGDPDMSLKNQLINNGMIRRISTLVPGLKKLEWPIQAKTTADTAPLKITRSGKGDIPIFIIPENVYDGSVFENATPK